MALADRAEFIIGTLPFLVDTSGDGMSDYAAVMAGLDPLNGRTVATGIVASVPLQGEAFEVTIEAGPSGTHIAYVATGSYGLALVNVRAALRPIVLSHIVAEEIADKAHLLEQKLIRKPEVLVLRRLRAELGAQIASNEATIARAAQKAEGSRGQAVLQVCKSTD